MDGIRIMTTGYKFVIANNTINLPSAAGAQNEVLDAVTACEDDWEDAILVASGLLPQLVARAREEAAR